MRLNQRDRVKPVKGITNTTANSVLLLIDIQERKNDPARKTLKSPQTKDEARDSLGAVEVNAKCVFGSCLGEKRLQCACGSYGNIDCR